MSARWRALREQRPDLAEAGRALLYQFGVGLAFIGTVRTDGGPRLHPVCPILSEEGLYAFVTPSLKRDDLHRDGRYALHSYPCPNNEDAFYVFGSAVLEQDPLVVETLRRAFLAERNWSQTPPASWGDQQIFELFIDRCLYTKTTGHGDFAPVHTVWRPDGR